MARKFWLGLAVTILAAACTAPATQAPPTTVPATKAVQPAATATPLAKKLRPLTVQLPWRNNGENAPLHVGLKAGYFEEQGLKVTLLEGGPGVPALNNVLSGQAEIGIIASLAGTIPPVAENVPIIMTGAILQKHPLAYVILEKNLTPEQMARPLTPKDLVKKRIGVQSEVELFALLQKNGLSPEDVTFRIIGGENPADLLTQSVDYASYWVVNQPLALEQQGLKWKALMYADWGVPFYADVVIATKSFLAKEEGQQVMRAFLRALSKSMQKMLDDPAFAVQATLQYGGGAETEALLKRRFELQSPMMISNDTKQHGLLWMDAERVKEAVKFYRSANQIRKEPAIADLMTLEYLK